MNMSYNYCVSSIYLIVISNSSLISSKCFFFQLKLYWRGHHTVFKEKCRLELLRYWVDIVRIKLPFYKHPFKMFRPFLDNLTKTIFHVFCLLFLLFCNLYKVEVVKRFRIGRKCNNCITYKLFSSNFLFLLFINVIKFNPKIFCANHFWLQVCSAQLLDCKIILLKERAKTIFKLTCFADIESRWCFHFFSWAKGLKTATWNFEDLSTVMYLQDLYPSLLQYPHNRCS